MNLIKNYDIFLNIVSLSCEMLLFWCLILHIIYSCFYYFGRYYIYIQSIMCVYLYSFLLVLFMVYNLDIIISDLFGGSFIINYSDILIRNIIMILGIPLIYFSIIFINNNYSLVNIIEYTILMYILLLATFFALYSNDMISLFLCIELQSMVMYILICLCSTFSSISMGIRYFLLGTIVSLVFLFLFTLLYYYVGISNFIDYVYISYFIDSSYFSYGMSVMYILFLFKLYIYPFHFIGGDLYRYSPIYILIVIASIIYYVYIYLFIKFVSYIYINIDLVSISIYCTLFLAVLNILVQRDIRSFLGFGTSVHSCFLLYLLLYDSYINISMCLFYALIYIVTIIGFFILFVKYSQVTFSVYACRNILSTKSVGLKTSYIRLHKICLCPLEYIVAWSGINKHHKWFTFIFGILFWSISGLPPFSGFFAKLGVLMMCYLAHNMLLLVFILSISVVSSLYYLRIIKECFYISKSRYYYATFQEFDLLVVFLVILLCLISVFLPEVLMYLFY